MNRFLLMSLLALTAGKLSAEDTELYISDVVRQAALKSQVLIIFDNSGSMNTEHSVKSSYVNDPDNPYPAVGGLNALQERFIYFTKGGVDNVGLPVPDSPSEARRFLDEINSCETARQILATKGFYTGHVREYRMKGNTGTWEEIPDNNGANIEILDCEDDVLNSDDTNIASLPKGFPINFEGDKKNPVYHTTDINKSNVSWTGELVTLYTDNYLRWHQSETIANTLETRLETAKRSITSVIETTPSIEFGLQIFNYNDDDEPSGPNGGRIVAGIREMTATNKANLIDIIDNQITAATWTPLCESLYEASQYFGGKAVTFGDKDESQGKDYTKNKPPRDTTIEVSGPTYEAPFSECSDKAYVILITDGEPTFDHAADSKITALPGFDGAPYTADGSNSYLPALAEWLFYNDVNPNLEGDQTVVTHTIGFSTTAKDAIGLLEATADATPVEEGKFIYADTGDSLTDALAATLRDLRPSNDTLTSASVAANNFDRTETLNSVYYAMFDPQHGPRWQGNLKKYEVVGNKQVGSNGKPAIDDATGLFNKEVLSIWSTEVDGLPDGDKVAEGGVVQWFSGKAPSDRTIYTDTNSPSPSAGLPLFNRTNLEGAFGSAAALATELGVTEAEIDDMLNWAKGTDVDDEDGDDDKGDMRSDVFGDPLHSKPLVVNYGNSIRIVVGTNAGAIHMFEDEGKTVKENWAFMPKEFLKNIKPLRENFPAEAKVYGIDGQITSYVDDLGGDGIINHADGDKVWIFFGLRRGGSSYYGMDISNPAAPKLMWHIDASTAGFGELGQSWSQPKVGNSMLHIEGSKAKPVLFFGGGYDPSKDNAGPGSPDSVGRAVYMVKAEDGNQILWSMAPSGGTTTFSGTDSIPSSIGILDSDGDGLVDRLYTGDTGGNLWRVDMPGNKPTGGTTPWSVFKLASLGGGTNETDRRFFNEPSIVRTFIMETIQTEIKDEHGNVIKTEIEQQEKPYDAVLIGSGDRSNPIGTDTNDIFFMIKDENIKTESFPRATTPPTPIAKTIADLHDFTDNPFGKTMTTQEREKLALEVSGKSGWFVDYSQSGEKTSSAAIVINGVAYFTSYTPPQSGAELIDCRPPTGAGWLYAMDLSLGTKIYNWSEIAGNREDRISYISEQYLGSPTLIVIPEDDGDPETPNEAKGNIIVGRTIIPVGFSLQTLRTYLYITEDQ